MLLGFAMTPWPKAAACPLSTGVSEALHEASASARHSLPGDGPDGVVGDWLSHGCLAASQPILPVLQEIDELAVEGRVRLAEPALAATGPTPCLIRPR